MLILYLSYFILFCNYYSLCLLAFYYICSVQKQSPFTPHMLPMHTAYSVVIDILLGLDVGLQYLWSAI